MKASLLLILFAGVIAGCSPVGSESWCEDMESKPQGEWSMKDGEDYMKHCLGIK